MLGWREVRSGSTRGSAGEIFLEDAGYGGVQGERKRPRQLPNIWPWGVRPRDPRGRCAWQPERGGSRQCGASCTSLFTRCFFPLLLLLTPRPQPLPVEGGAGNSREVPWPRLRGGGQGPAVARWPIGVCPSSSWPLLLLTPVSRSVPQLQPALSHARAERSRSHRKTRARSRGRPPVERPATGEARQTARGGGKEKPLSPGTESSRGAQRCCSKLSSEDGPARRTVESSCLPANLGGRVPLEPCLWDKASCSRGHAAGH